MKINFGTYTWFGDLDDKRNITYNSNDPTQKEFGKCKFNEDYFSQLMSDREYEKAANYANEFHFNDPAKQREHLNNIANIRRNGRILESCYNKINDIQTLKQVEFFDKVFVNGGLETLKDNNYANIFKEIKKQFGSGDINKNPNNEATDLAITFYPKTRKLFGIDWLAKDNDNNIEAFYKRSGLNERNLKANGVDVENKDGKTILRFSKSNNLANKIINNLYDRVRAGGFGYGDERSSLLPDDWNIQENDIEGFNAKGQSVYKGKPLYAGAPNKLLNDLNKLNTIIDGTRNTKDVYFRKNDLTTKQYSSTIAGNIDDNLAMLQDALNNGEIDKQTFNREYRINCGYLDDILRNIGSGEYEMYSNKFNKETNDETLRPIDNNDRSELINAITSTDKSKMHLVSMISNGKIGTLVELDAPSLTSKQQESLNGDEDDQLSNGRRIQIFIPGLFQEQAQEKINRNTSSRAIQEVNSMQDYDYDYKTQDGSTLTYDGLGGYIYNGEQIDKNKAIKIINKDLIIQDGVNNLLFNYVNKDNELIDKKGYEAMSRIFAIKAVNDIDPGVPLSYSDGTPLTEEEIFSHSNANPDDVYFGKIQYQVYDKLQNLYDVYNSLMQAISYYN